MAVSGPSAPPGHDHTGHSQRRKSLLVGEAGGDSPPVNPSLALSQCCMPRNIFGLIHMTFCKRVHLTQLFRSASRCFIHVFLSVFYISPDIESCTLKEYLIIYPHLTCIHTHSSAIEVFLSPSTFISILYLGSEYSILSDDGKVWSTFLSYLSLWPLAIVTGWATDEK